MSDREMIVKWFEFCRVEDKCSTDCPYFDNTGSARECTNKLAKDVLTLLKEQEAVRCKNCAYAISNESIQPGHIVCTKPFTERWQVVKPDSWFCADWERKEGR